MAWPELLLPRNVVLVVGGDNAAGQDLLGMVRSVWATRFGLTLSLPPSMPAADTSELVRLAFLGAHTSQLAAFVFDAPTPAQIASKDMKALMFNGRSQGLGVAMWVQDARCLPPSFLCQFNAVIVLHSSNRAEWVLAVERVLKWQPTVQLVAVLACADAHPDAHATVIVTHDPAQGSVLPCNATKKQDKQHGGVVWTPSTHAELVWLLGMFALESRALVV